MWDIGALHESHDRFLAEHDAMVSGVLYDAGNIAVAEVITHPTFTPRTGALQKATRARVIRTAGGKLVRVSNLKSYASGIEQGTRPHRITARNAKALRWLTTNGSVVFRRSVSHPGTKPYWFLRTAVNTASSRAERMLLAGMQKIARSPLGR